MSPGGHTRKGLDHLTGEASLVFRLAGAEGSLKRAVSSLICALGTTVRIAFMSVREVTCSVVQR